ncbi:hypothetical protein ACJ41O_001891 [Fusarium nematophilum]
MDQDGPFGPVVNGTQIVFYEYRPNKPAAICFVVLFGLGTVAQLVCLFRLRETFGYYGRALSHDEPERSGPFILQNVLLLAGPPFLAATIHGSRWLTKIYVLIDIGCICSQFIGALMPVSGDADSVRKG